MGATWRAAPWQRPIWPGEGRLRAVVDSDAYNEIDDQFAIAYALCSQARLKVEAVYAAPFLNERSTSPADGMRKSLDEILRLLGRAGAPVEGFAFPGSRTFLTAAGKPVESPAAHDLVSRAMQPGGGPLYVVSIGAPTNVASAILMQPRIKERIVVVWLGGQPHDSPSAAEFNLRQDVFASRTLYDSEVPLVNIPTRSVSEHLRTTVPEVERFLKGRSSLGDYLSSEFGAYARSKSPDGEFAWSKALWDVAAVAWLINPDWVSTRTVPSPILTDDLKFRANAARHLIRVAFAVDRNRIFTDMFRKLIG